MTAIDIAVIVVVSVAFAAAVGFMIYRKIKHKGGCDCGCSDCCHCSRCGKENNRDKN